MKRALKAAEEAGLEWPLPDEMGDDAIRRLIYPKKFGKRGEFLDPDYRWVHEQLTRKGVTRALFYAEYRDGCRASGAMACSVTTFNSGYAEWAVSQCLTMHIERKPGQRMEVDWAGTKMGESPTAARSASPGVIGKREYGREFFGNLCRRWRLRADVPGGEIGLREKRAAGS